MSDDDHEKMRKELDEILVLQDLRTIASMVNQESLTTLDFVKLKRDAMTEFLGPWNEYAYAWFSLCSKFLQINSLRAALIACDEGLRLNPNDALMWSARGGILNQGVQEVAMAIMMSGNKWKPLLEEYLGKNLQSQDISLATEGAKTMRKMAIEAYHKATELDPDNDVFWAGLADLLAQANSDDAAAAFMKAIELNPDDKLYWTSLYHWYIKKDQEADAKQLEEKAKNHNLDLKKEYKAHMERVNEAKKKAMKGLF